MTETIVEVREPTEQKSTAYCPCCGSSAARAEVILDRQQGIVTLNGVSARTNPQQTTILTTLLRAWPNAASSDSLIFAMYGDADEPDSAREILCINVSRLRTLIKPLGMSIGSTFGHGYKLNTPRDVYVNKLSVNRRAA